MAKKILGLGDLKVLRNTSSRGAWVEPQEQQSVMNLVGDSAFALYYLLRTYPFRESEEITDDNLAKLLGWSRKKTQRYRLVLEQNELYQTVRYGSKTDGITKVFVGADTVALFNAGLPADIINPKALTKLKRKLSIKTSAEVVANHAAIVQEYSQNPEEYLC